MSKLKYDQPRFDPSRYSRHHIDRQAVEQIPIGSRVLELGCATGFMGEYLIKHRGCTVYGVDLRAPELHRAAKVLDGVLAADLEAADLVRVLRAGIGPTKFDVILATSVLEHLRDPGATLHRLRQLLTPSGLIVATTPNIAHWTTRLMLLRGRFDYTEYGIMDNTHTRFFTARTFQELFTQHGFRQRHFSIDAEGGGYPRLSLFLAGWWPGLFAYQLLYVGEKERLDPREDRGHKQDADQDR